VQAYRLVIAPNCTGKEVLLDDCSSGGGNLALTSPLPLRKCGSYSAEQLQLPANQTAFSYEGERPGRDYLVSASAVNGAGVAGAAAVLAVETRGRRPERPPHVVRVRQTFTNSLMVEFDFPCPHSGSNL
jgi:hypothetical protein